MATTLRAILPHLVALLFGFGLMQMGNTLQGTLLSIRGDIQGFSPAQIGVVGASFWAGIVVRSFRSGMLIERGGHIRTFAAIASTIPLLHLLLIDPWQQACNGTKSASGRPQGKTRLIVHEARPQR
jgi:hypothetical protein